MRMILVTLCVAFLGGGSLFPTQGTQWHGITPFHSTRADVERLLGKPDGDCRCQYNLNGDRIRIDYSGDRCGKQKWETWDVPPETVLTITVHPQKQCPLATYKLDPQAFQKTDDPELHGYALYTSDVDGVGYQVTDEGKVFMIMYSGSKKDRTVRRCK